MTTKTTVGATAADQKYGLTFEEIARFVDEGRSAGVAGSTHVKGTSTWREAIRSLTVQVEVDLGG